MSDFVENFKKNAGKIIDTTSTITKATIKKTSESVNILKLKYSIKEVESNIDHTYISLGKMIYNEYLNGADFDDEYQTKCEKIDNLYEKINKLNIKISEISNHIICPDCGKYLSVDSRFCSACGHEFDTE